MTATRPPASDDRLSAPIEASRRGAHRARPKPVSAGLPVLAGLAVVLLVLGAGYFVLTGNGSDESANDQAASALDGPSATGSPSGSAPASDTTQPSGSPQPSETPQPSGSTEPSGPAQPSEADPVDRGLKLKVLNSTATKGLAARVQSGVVSKGWTVDKTGNSINRNLPVTKIYFGRTADRPTAAALQQDLGYGTVVRDAGVTRDHRIVVVLGQDAS